MHRFFTVSNLFFVFCFNSSALFEFKASCFLQLVLEPCGRTAENNSVGPKITTTISPFLKGSKRARKKWVLSLSLELDARNAQRSLHRILPPFPTSPPSTDFSPRYVPRQKFVISRLAACLVVNLHFLVTIRNKIKNGTTGYILT